jgi:3',5'-cyclic-AMP phosphodiesterase
MKIVRRAAARASMTRIAHLTDFHLLEERYAERPLATRARLTFLSAGRKFEPRERRARAALALARARAEAPDHLVLTGDLTEDGSLAQFEVLAELLEESGLPKGRITIVPGNHDFYDHARTWARALAGPLRPYRESSRARAPVVFDDVAIVPVSTGFHQCFAWSGGAIGSADLQKVDRIARDRAFRDRPIVLAQHHPPHGHFWPVAQWIDGLRDAWRLLALLRARPRLHVLHGHTHQAIDRPVDQGEAARVFSGEAVVASSSPLRMYEVRGVSLVPLPCHGNS